MTHFVGLVILPKGTKIEKCGYDSPGMDKAMYGDQSKGEPMFKMSYQEAHEKFNTEPSPSLQEALTAVLDAYDENKETPPYREYETEEAIERMVDHYTSKKDKKDKTSYGQLRYEGRFPPYPSFDWKKNRRDKIWLLNIIIKQFIEDWNGCGLHEYDGSEENTYEWEANIVAGAKLVRCGLEFGKTEAEDRFWYWRTYNPKSKWDWYSIGGRWHGYLHHKNGERVNILRIKDIDWEARRKEMQGYAEEGWKIWEKAVLDAGFDPAKPAEIEKAFERFHLLRKKRREYELKVEEAQKSGKKRLVRNGALTTKEVKELEFLDEPVKKMSDALWHVWNDEKIIGATEEEYKTIPERPVPPSHLILDGVWHERWEMGWWGMHGKGPTDEEWSKTFYDKLDACDPDSVVVAIDFHI